MTKSINIDALEITYDSEYKKLSFTPDRDQIKNAFEATLEVIINEANALYGSDITAKHLENASENMPDAHLILESSDLSDESNLIALIQAYGESSDIFAASLYPLIEENK